MEQVPRHYTGIWDSTWTGEAYPTTRRGPRSASRGRMESSTLVLGPGQGGWYNKLIDVGSIVQY